MTANAEDHDMRRGYSTHIAVAKAAGVVVLTALAALLGDNLHGGQKDSQVKLDAIAAQATLATASNRDALDAIGEQMGKHGVILADIQEKQVALGVRVEALEADKDERAKRDTRAEIETIVQRLMWESSNKSVFQRERARAKSP